VHHRSQYLYDLTIINVLYYACLYIGRQDTRSREHNNDPLTCGTMKGATVLGTSVQGFWGSRYDVSFGPLLDVWLDYFSSAEHGVLFQYLLSTTLCIYGITWCRVLAHSQNLALPASTTPPSQCGGSLPTRGNMVTHVLTVSGMSPVICRAASHAPPNWFRPIIWSEEPVRGSQLFYILRRSFYMTNELP